MSVAAAAVVLALLALALFGMGRLVLKALKLGKDGGPAEADPMFAPTPEVVTRPPEAPEGPGLSREEADPSHYWNEGEQVPVDMTAEELAGEGLATQAP